METQDKLDIQATGSVEGDVIVQSLQVADKARFEGSCSMRRQAKPAEKSKLNPEECPTLS